MTDHDRTPPQEMKTCVCGVSADACAPTPCDRKMAGLTPEEAPVAWQMRVMADSGRWFAWDHIDQDEYNLYARSPTEGVEVRALYAKFAPAAGAPVAWRWRYIKHGENEWRYGSEVPVGHALEETQPLYASPQVPSPAGSATEDELAAAIFQDEHPDVSYPTPNELRSYRHPARAILAKFDVRRRQP